jgi:hypothetical protein
MSNYYSTKFIPDYTVSLGEGFQTKTRNKDHLEKHGLIGTDLLSFVNDLCVLVDEKKSELPKEEWENLAFTLLVLMVTYDTGELYYYLLHSYGADAINYNAWVHFVSDSDWRTCVRAFTDMPTAILEEYGAKEWQGRIHKMYRANIEQFLKAISERTDIYGANGGLPSEMVEGILFSSP